LGVYHAFSVFIQSWMTPRLILLFESRGVKVKNRFCFVRPLNERDLNTIEPILNVRTPWVTTPSISDSFFRFQKNQRCGILRINILKFQNSGHTRKWLLTLTHSTTLPIHRSLTDWESWNAEENWLVNIWLIAERDAFFYEIESDSPLMFLLFLLRLLIQLWIERVFRFRLAERLFGHEKKNSRYLKWINWEEQAGQSNGIYPGGSVGRFRLWVILKGWSFEQKN